MHELLSILDLDQQLIDMPQQLWLECREVLNPRRFLVSFVNSSLEGLTCIFASSSLKVAGSLSSAPFLYIILPFVKTVSPSSTVAFAFISGLVNSFTLFTLLTLVAHEANPREINVEINKDL
jgi:hypothetical protein